MNRSEETGCSPNFEDAVDSIDFFMVDQGFLLTGTWASFKKVQGVAAECTQHRWVYLVFIFFMTFLHN